MVKTTHLLRCRHCVGHNHCREYTMPCNILGKTKSGKIKIEVFGERDWANREHIRKVRYVQSYRLIANKGK